MTSETRSASSCWIDGCSIRTRLQIKDFASAWAGIARQIEDAHQESKRIDATFILLYFPQKEEVYWELAKDRIKVD